MQECTQVKPESMAVVENNFAEWRRVFGRKLEEVAEAHPPRAEVDLQSLADMMNGVFEGAFILGRIFNDHRTFAQQARHYRTYLELLFGVQ